MPLEIKRDRWERPILPHPMTGVEEPYTRASTMSTAIENTFNLEKWKQRRIIVGLSERPDLVAKIQGNPNDKNLLNEVIEIALELGGSTTGANIGTAIHSFCEMLDRGETLPRGVDKRIQASVNLYYDTLFKGFWKVLRIEEFVATRAVMAAGTFDRILEKDGRFYVADIKTGANAPEYAHSAAVQMAIYSRGQKYDPKEGWGLRMPEDAGVNQNIGIMIHLPATGEPVCRLYEVDLETGWKMARIAHRVRQWWKEKPTELMT